jgi:cyclic-di-AMP phosphodiesterase PgpH
MSRNSVSGSGVPVPAAIALAAFFAAGALLILTLGPGSADSREAPAALAEGAVADADVTAAREISFVDENATRLRIDAEMKLVLPVFIVDGKPAMRAVERFGDFRDLVSDLASRQVAEGTLFLQIQSAFPGVLSKQQVLELASSPQRSQALAFADSILRRLLDRGIAAMPASGLEDYNPDYAELRFLETGKALPAATPMSALVTLKTLPGALEAEIADRRLSRPLASLVSTLVRSFAVEDAFFDPALSAKGLAAARDSVEPVVRTIAKGERIVRKGAVVTASDAAKLAAARTAVAKMEWGATLGSIALLAASMALGMLVLGKAISGTSLRRPSAYLAAAAAFLYFAAALLTARLAGPAPLELGLLLPTALYAMVATVLAGPRFSVLMSAALALLAQSAAGLDARLLSFCLLSGTAATFAVRDASSRIDLVRAGAVLAVLEAAIAAALAAPGAESAGAVLVSSLYGAINGFGCALFALAILPVLEQALNAPTRFRLMELSDLNAPILKRLLTVAPGTYSHSVTVAHLAESACREIGADPLLARVGAYYHDIGKIEQPEYFIENQSGYNKHDEINPRLSATVIRSHVKIGAEKARALGLPEAVVDIVAQHHGNGVIAWFYDQAKKGEGEVEADDFSYPGQPPSSREAAVVMLADAVEAATRSLKNPTMPRLEDFIGDIVMDRVRDGQLDHCDLTLKDLETIRNSFTRILAGHFHSRIEYPKAKEQQR